MRYIHFFLAIALAGCTGNKRQNESVTTNDSVKIQAEPIPKIKTKKPTAPLSTIRTYSNERFKEVAVEQIDEHQFLVSGKGQIFEANFNWVVEDGHEELRKGFQMTDAGAPEWGNFKFIIDVKKKRANSTLNLILFESSAKDGSRQHELHIVLY